MPNHSAFWNRNDSPVTLSTSRNAVSFSSAPITKRFPSPWHFAAKNSGNKLRGARIHGDLPWRGETISQHGAQITASPHRVSVHSSLQKLFNPKSSILSRKKMHIYEICLRKDKCGVDPISDSGSDHAAAMIRTELARWRPIIQALGLGAEPPTRSASPR